MLIKPILVVGTISLLTPTIAQLVTNSSDGYTGYGLRLTGDDDSVLYETTSTQVGASANDTSPPDVYLNASVSVGSLDIGVRNLTAKINLEASVLNLLQFNAGVDLSVDRVDLLIENVTAKVLLEARLGNLVAMVTDVLESIDLNPAIVSLGEAVSEVGDSVGGAVGDIGTTVLGKRDTIENVLYSVNDYAGDAHTNRVLLQNGDVVDQFLDNDGRVKSTAAVGDYTTLFQSAGEQWTSTIEEATDPSGAIEREYLYSPYVGLDIVALLSFDAQGRVVSTKVLSGLSAGGTSSISN